MRSSVIYSILILIAFSACSKKQYASFCPGEKQTHQKHKTFSEHEKAKVKQGIIKISQSQKEEKEEIIFEASKEISPDISNNPVQQRIKKHRLKHFEKQKPEKIVPVNHKRSIWAFILYFGGFFVLGIPVLIGIFWSISNLFYLRKRKNEYKLKGFSIAVASFHLFFTMVILAAVFAEGPIVGAFAFLLYGLLFFLGIIGMLCLIALALYAYGDNVF